MSSTLYDRLPEILRKWDLQLLGKPKPQSIVRVRILDRRRSITGAMLKGLKFEGLELGILDLQTREATFYIEGEQEQEQ
jgi:hypothetical protein